MGENGGENHLAINHAEGAAVTRVENGGGEERKGGDESKTPNKQAPLYINDREIREVVADAFSIALRYVGYSSP